MDGDRRRERAVLRVNLGCFIVTNGDFATRLFPNYFGQYLLLSVVNLLKKIQLKIINELKL